MKLIHTKFEMILSGAKISEDFSVSHVIHANYVSDVKCVPADGSVVHITGIISSEDKNTNYLIAEEVKEYFHRLFSLFGVSCRVEKFKIDTTTDFLEAQIEVRPPVPLIDGNAINNQASKLINQYSDSQKTGIFHNFIESNNSIDILHRFRSLFSVFDSLSPKTSQGYIDYDALKSIYVNEIIDRYQGAYIPRYLEILNEMCNANLIDNRANKDYSALLKFEKQGLSKTVIINDSVAYNLMKCIQIIRNKVNHGDFTGLSRKIVAGGYELLLPLTQKLLRE